VSTNPIKIDGGNAANNSLPGADGNVTITIVDAAADGSTKGAATFNADHFDAASGVISLDTTNGPFPTDAEAAAMVTYETMATNGDVDTDLSDGATASTFPSSAAVVAYADSVAGGAGTVDVSGTPEDDDVAIWTDADTLEGSTWAELNRAIGTDIQAQDATLQAIDDAADVPGSIVDIANTTAETNIAADDLILIYDTSATANRAMTRGNFVTGIGAGQAITLDLADDGSDESTDLGEIAIVNDTNGIFSEPSADKLEIDVSAKWPIADAADAASSQAITDNAIATVDDADAADNDFARFTANGLEGRSYAEVRGDLGLDSAANLETNLSLGAYASDILGAADSDALVTLLGLVAGDIPDLSGTYEVQLNNEAGLYAVLSNVSDFLQPGDPIDSTVIGGSTPAAGTFTTLEAGAGGFTVDPDGDTLVKTLATAAATNPYWHFNQSTADDFWIGSYDTTVDRLELRKSVTVNTSVLSYWDANHQHLDGNMNLTTGHTYQINDTQIALTNLSDGLSHASGHIQGGADEIDGDLIDIDYAETNYTPATTGVASDVNHLSAHLEGIDAALGALGGGTLVGLTDVGGDDVYTEGFILIGDGSDSYDPKAVSGAAKIDGTGDVTLTVTDTTDTTSYVALWESATGDLDPKSDDGLTYNAGTGVLTATGFAGPLTGNVTGTASGNLTAETNDLETIATGIAANEIPIGTDADTITYGTDLPTATTIGSGYIYRAGGTDVADADVANDITIAAGSQIASGSPTFTSVTANYTIVTPQSLSVTTEDDVTVGTELTSSVVLLTGDDDSDDDTLTLQDGVTAGTILTFICVAGLDAVDDALIIDAETDSTCLGCPDSGIFTYETAGSQLTLYWTGSAWVYAGSAIGE
jgi:hypothetical protein